MRFWKRSHEQSFPTGSAKLLLLKEAYMLASAMEGVNVLGLAEVLESGELCQLTSSLRLLRSTLIIWLGYLWHEESISNQSLMASFPRRLQKSQL